MPDFSQRSSQAELMDDFSIDDARLANALVDLRRVNRYLGGHATTMQHLEPLLRRARPDAPLQVLDVATGGADFPEYLMRAAVRQGWHVHPTALDVNDATLGYARVALEERLPPRLAGQIDLQQGDALSLPFADDTFDVSVTSLFMHHLNDGEAVQMLQELDRTARLGFIVNDLHRHPLAYYGVTAWAYVTNASEFFRHDAPVSVLRGFTRDELEALVQRAGLPQARIQWHWAFRWTISTTHTNTQPYG